MAGLRIVALWAACAASVSCGGFYFVGFVSNPGGTISITGIVIAVSNGFVADPSGVTQYTAVTFMNDGSEITVNFCGDQRLLFPIDATVRTDYTTGIFCSVVLRVVVSNERAESKDSACLRHRIASIPDRCGGNESTPRGCVTIAELGPSKRPEDVLSFLSVVTSSSARDYEACGCYALLPRWKDLFQI